ncbi:MULTISPECIES: DUF4304 domain-containing protein [Lysinibacillus]|uniref:DUF4304 domain-containing protein n=1 Tax=Lysinibacillus TaxID=400634 RepID=UPI002152691B|nr:MULTISPECIES: DUF4304 domain-containing protein [Lysinibacillus]WCH49874.1 DUF4304 domain-containing protein [Lysinibacillus sp. OF-1]
MQQIFNKLIKQNIKPFLSMLGYNKKSLNFYKTTDNLNYMFNFQKSANNMFYMNCYIYATELAHVQSKEILTASKEAECHFRARIESIVEGTT